MQMRFKDGRFKALTLSYDDGASDDRKLVEILNRYGIKATFNLNSGYMPDKESGGKISFEEGRSLYIGNGHEVAVHTLTHPWLVSLKNEEMVYEIVEDRKNLEREFGTIVRGMAYPYGCYSDRTVDALKASGIVYSRTVTSTHNFNMPEDWLRLPATCHHNDAELMNLAERFVNEKSSYGRCIMFYLWGHSFEFERNGNWDIIENFCKLTGGREDIWYATNIEIYDYVKAYEALQVSVELGRVFNPTAQTVWFEHKGTAYSIKPGELIDL